MRLRSPYDTPKQRLLPSNKRAIICCKPRPVCAPVCFSAAAVTWIHSPDMTVRLSTARRAPTCVVHPNSQPERRIVVIRQEGGKSNENGRVRLDTLGREQRWRGSLFKKKKKKIKNFNPKKESLVFVFFCGCFFFLVVVVCCDCERAEVCSV